MSTPEPDPNPIDALLGEAQEAANQGRAAQSLALARQALELALQHGDETAQARALSVMANCELRVVGQFKLAYEHSQRAAFLFERSRHTAGECAALGTLAIAATHLAQYEDGVESGLLGVQLANTLPPGQEQVMAYHCLGLASYYGKSFEQAVWAYDRAVGVARACGLNTFQLHLNQAVCECFGYFNERALHGPLPTLERLAAHVELCEQRLRQDSTNISLTPASHWNNVVIKVWAAALLQAWSGNDAAADAQLQDLEPWAGRIQQSWLGAATSWARAEVALAKGDVDAAAAWTRDMSLIAEYYGHESLCILSDQLMAHLHELGGRPADAMRQMRLIVRREQKVRAESLRNRARVIGWQMELREKKVSVRHLQQQTAELAHQATHDALTGLANRRVLESRLEQCLRQAPGPGNVYLAILDVDRFKQVNDTHSHAVGDAVLVAIARALDSNIRSGDVAARLGGDEFCVLLGDTTEAEAQAVCARIGEAIRAHDWPALSRGLFVSASIGLSAASTGDTLESLLERSDKQMYSNKRRRA